MFKIHEMLVFLLTYVILGKCRQKVFMELLCSSLTFSSFGTRMCYDVVACVCVCVSVSVYVRERERI